MASPTDYLKRKDLSVSSVNDGGTTQNKAQALIIKGEETTFNLNNSLDVSSNITDAESLAFNDDGSKLYICDDDSSPASVNEYSLSTAFDISTASFSQSLDVSSSTSFPVDLSFNDTGTKLFLNDNTTANIYEYNLSTAFDISTASFSQSFDVSNQEGIPDGLEFNKQGTKMYITGVENANIYEYNLSTAFDISTASFSQSFDVSNQDTNPEDVALNNNEDKIYIAGETTQSVYEYNFLDRQESKTGTGNIVIGFSNVNGAEDVGLYDQNGNLLDYEIESLDTTAETATIWAYNSWVRDDTVQAQIAYGDNSANEDRSVAGSGSNPWENGQNADYVQHFEESSSPLLDSSGNNYDIGDDTDELQGTTYVSNASIGPGRSFDGTDDYLIATQVAVNSSNNGATILGYFKPDVDTSGDGNQHLFYKLGSGPGLKQEEDGLITIEGMGDFVNNINVSYNTSDFHQFASRITTGGNHELVFNSNSINSVSTGGNMDSSSTDVVVGNSSADGRGLNQLPWSGNVAEFRVYRERKSDDWMQADYDASPGGGQVYFSQQAAETTLSFNGATTTASATGSGETVSLSGSTTQATTTASATGSGATIFIEPDFGTLAATPTATGNTISLSGTTTLNTVTAAAEGAGGESNITLIITPTTANASGIGGTINTDRLSGFVDVENQPTAGVDVNVIDKTNNLLYETTTDSNGDWVVDSGDGKVYQVAYLFDDGSTYYGDAEESDTT